MTQDVIQTVNDLHSNLQDPTWRHAFLLLTEEIVDELLKLNTINRDVYENHKDRLKTDMEYERFYWHSQLIPVRNADEKGNFPDPVKAKQVGLLDPRLGGAQHRLLALKDAYEEGLVNEPLWTCLMFGMTEDARQAESKYVKVPSKEDYSKMDLEARDLYLGLDNTVCTRASSVIMVMENPGSKVGHFKRSTEKTAHLPTMKNLAEELRERHNEVLGPNVVIGEKKTGNYQSYDSFGFKGGSIGPLTGVYTMLYRQQPILARYMLACMVGDDEVNPNEWATYSGLKNHMTSLLRKLQLLITEQKKRSLSSVDVGIYIWIYTHVFYPNLCGHDIKWEVPDSPMKLQLSGWDSYQPKPEIQKLIDEVEESLTSVKQSA